MINTSVAGSRSIEDVYTTRTVEINNETGEVIKDKTKTQTRTRDKRKVKK